MTKTFVQTSDGVSINGFFIKKDLWLGLEPSYTWSDEVKKRIYRVDGTRPSVIDPTVDLTIGAHVVVNQTNEQISHPFPWAKGDEYCSKVKQYQAACTDHYNRIEASKKKEDIEAYKKIVRDHTPNAKSKEDKAEVEAVLVEMEKHWDSPLVIVGLGKKLEKFYDNSHLMEIIARNTKK